MRGSDEELALLAAAGDRAAFGVLVRRHQGLVRGMLARLARDRAEADDLAQEAFMKAWRKIGDLEAAAGFKAWLCSIAYREFLMQRRRRAASERTTEALSAEAAAAPGADPPARLGDLLDLDRALTTLSESERACVVLCYAGGLSHAEAAAATGLPLGTVKSHVARGREKLRDRMMAEAKP